LYPGLVLADAIQSLGDPASGDPAVVVAHEAHWQELRETFEAWPSSDPQGPLNWLTAQGGLGQVARDQAQAAEGTACWWLPGDWPALVLADLAGTDPELNRRFETAEAMINALKTWQEGEPRPLIALTPTLLAAVLSEQAPLPRGAVVLNLCWPEPDLQSAWLHLLARATAVLECRPAVRAYLKSLGLSVSWPSPSVRQTLPQTASGLRYLLLSLTESAAEATLARHAEKLDPYRYSAFLRLDAQMLSLESEAKSPIAWLEAVREKHDRWVWLTGTPTPEDIRTWSIQAWAEQRGVAMQMLEQNDATWVTALCKPETDA
jgi:hypothetical protein